MKKLVFIAYIHHVHATFWSPTELLALGTGLAFAGALVLALGLMTRPKHFAERISRSGNTSVAVNIRAAEDRIDAFVGVGAMVAGFGIQGASTVWSLGYVPTAPYSALSYALTAGLFVIPVPLIWLVDRYVRPLQVRRHLVEMAHYGNRSDARQSAPSMRELRLYGNVLKGGYEQSADEADEDYAKRIWHVNNIRND